MFCLIIVSDWVFFEFILLCYWLYWLGFFFFWGGFYGLLKNSLLRKGAASDGVHGGDDINGNMLESIKIAFT